MVSLPNTETWLSGRKRLTANEVDPLNGLVSSNLTVSADENSLASQRIFIYFSAPSSRSKLPIFL